MSALHSGVVTSENAEQRRNSRWHSRQTLLAVAVAVVIGGVGGAAIYAATGQPQRTFGAAPHGVGQQHGGQSHPGGPPMGPAQQDPPGVLHSESVVSDGTGGYATKLAQTGTVDEVTPSSVVVRSDDGFTQIYAFPADAAGSTSTVQPADTVTVEATRVGATVTLNRIAEAPTPEN
jgi:hypothetical protein